jgi:hypothetical protein
LTAIVSPFLFEGLDLSPPQKPTTVEDAPYLAIKLGANWSIGTHQIVQRNYIRHGGILSFGAMFEHHRYQTQRM